MSAYLRGWLLSGIVLQNLARLDDALDLVDDESADTHWRFPLALLDLAFWGKDAVLSLRIRLSFR